MNEFLRTFVMKTIKDMIDRVAEYQVRQYALGWLEKQVLTETDLIEIDTIYAEKAKEKMNTEEEVVK